ncbi:MAG: UDP-N-acetylmuramoyl-L-alanine--D-glutamate ligase [Candidatus Aminicenantales bacterium]
MHLKDKKVLIVGLGKTGEALAQFLLEKGARVKISEKKQASELGYELAGWKNRGVEIETGTHVLSSFLEADLIIPSPGVPKIFELEEARKKNIPIVSEIELASHYLRGKIVGVTGTNGKSTTATLIHKILKEGGLEAFLAGNIGIPLISFVHSSRESHIYVTEISSFQLEYIDTFRAPISVFLNISSNHLDWHPSFSSYFEAKKKLLRSQKKGDAAVLNRDDQLVWPLRKEGDYRSYGFSRKHKVAPGCFLKEDWIVILNQAEERLMPLSEISLPGTHNRENIMAAALVGHLFQIPLPRMRESIKTFQGLEHRLEKVMTLEGVEFVNDSKATTVDAAIKAMESFDRKIILIMGGRDKGADFRKLRRPVRKKVKKIILIGESREKIQEALEGTAPIQTAVSLKEAVFFGFQAASPQEIVLLAPACTSFDIFKNFEERGEVFKREVRELARIRQRQRT